MHSGGKSQQNVSYQLSGNSGNSGNIWILVSDVDIWASGNLVKWDLLWDFATLWVEVMPEKNDNCFSRFSLCANPKIAVYFAVASSNFY